MSSDYFCPRRSFLTPITVHGQHLWMSITFAGKINWPVQGLLKGFYVNCEKVKNLFSAYHLLDKTFQMMYSNLGLSFCWTLPLRKEETLKK